MIIQEIVTINNKQLKHTYSSEQKQIQQIETGAIYDEAYDTLKRSYNYIELDINIPDKQILEED